MQATDQDLRNTVVNPSITFSVEACAAIGTEIAFQANMLEPVMSRITLRAADGRRIQLNELFSGPPDHSVERRNARIARHKKSGFLATTIQDCANILTEHPQVCSNRSVIVYAVVILTRMCN